MSFTLNNRFTLIIELLAVFIALPLFLAFNPFIPLNFGVIAIGLIYLMYVSKQLWGYNTYREMLINVWHTSKQSHMLSSQLWLRITLMFAAFALATSIYMLVYLPEQSFAVLRNRPLVWLAICFIYVLLSVVPQEYIYRVYFFKRYSMLNLPSWLFIALNATLFSMAHLMFFDVLVLALTFFGGLLFAYSYKQSQSFIVICVEHSLYGLWLFTVGMGSMLAFPGA